MTRSTLATPTHRLRTFSRVAVIFVAFLVLSAATATAAIRCLTYRVTDPAGNQKCGVYCSDNTVYPMGCNAQIFDNGYDKDVNRSSGPTGTVGSIGLGDITQMIDAMRDLGHDITDEDASLIEDEMLQRSGEPAIACSPQALTVPMLEHFEIDFDQEAVEALTPDP